MSGKTVSALLAALAAGFVFGQLFNRPSTDHASEEHLKDVADSASNEVSAAETNSKPREQQLLMMAIKELDLTSSELKDARNELQRMERKARRYDWLRDNGLHGDHSMSFDKTSFEPSQKLLDFLGLSKEEADEMKRISKEAFASARNWEEENAVCTTDNSTNCVYAVEALPDTFKGAYLEQLGTLLHAEDVQLLERSIDDLYEDASGKREISVTFIPADIYAEQMTQRGQKHFSPSDMMKVQIQRFTDSGNKSGSTSSTFGLSHSASLTHNRYLQRWSHLFDVESFMPES